MASSSPQKKTPPRNSKRKKNFSVYFTQYSDEQTPTFFLWARSLAICHQKFVFPILSPDPGNDTNISLGKYSLMWRKNRGAASFTPPLRRANNTVLQKNASVAGNRRVPITPV